MSRKVTSYRLPEMTLTQIEQLSRQAGASDANIITIAIDRMFRQEIKTMNTSKYEYSVIEDNGGGLHLFLFEPDTETPVKGFTGFEYAPGSLATSLDSLDEGDDAHNWDGAMDDVLEQWQYVQGNVGYQVICHGDGKTRKLWPDHMGRAGQIEFGVEAEQP